MLTSDKIATTVIEPHKTVLHLGCGDQELKSLLELTKYVGVDIKQPADIIHDLNTGIEGLPNGFDYVLLSGILEYVEDPVKLIEEVSTLGRDIIILECKYYEEHNKDEWKKVWKDIGLEWHLQRIYEYHRAVYLGHTTVHECRNNYYGK